MQAQISLCAKIGYMYCCEYAQLLKKHTEHTCMSAIYYDQSSEIKADKCKMIVRFDTLLESKILDTGGILILSNLQKSCTIVCKDVDRTFDLEYSTYRILNRSELCECSLTEGNYLLSQATSNCGGMPEVKDGSFTTYYAFNRMILDVLTEKFDQQLHVEVKCVLLSTYTFVHLYMIFMPFYINDSVAQVTHFSSTLKFRLDILTMHYFFTTLYLMMIL